jgi:hypothetical protein
VKATTGIPLRKQPKDGYYWQDNELIDLYASIIGPFATIVYGALCRNAYGEPTVRYSVRDLASRTGMSATIAARSIEVLETAGLIKRLPTRGNQKSVCQLFDVKALASSHGATRERKSAPLKFPTSTVDWLNAQLNTIRRRQQGKDKQRVLSSAKRNAAIAARSGFSSLFSVSQRDASVSPAKSKRPTRETQTGSSPIQEERRIEECPTPTPTPTPTPNEGSDDGEAQKNEDIPGEDEPDRLLKLARVKFTGVMNDLGDHLFDTSRPPAPNVANGAADWEEFGFNSLAVEAATWCDGGLELTLSTSDPVTAQRGLEKYHRTFEASLRTRYGCEVKVYW